MNICDLNTMSQTQITNLLKSEYAPLLMEALCDLREDVLYKSIIHGVGHVRRVMVLGAIIAMQQRLSVDDARLLLLACSYHDIGRVNDSRDNQHGERAADMLNSGLVIASPGEVACIKAAIATHSTDDYELGRFMEKYRVDDTERCIILTKCLKDADNLDRVRLGDLDLSHLRFKESKLLKPVAEDILLEIRGEGILWQRFMSTMKKGLKGP